MQSKLNIFDAALMSGFFLWLMGYRLWAHWGQIGSVSSLLILGALSAMKVLEANLGFAVGIRPAWWALIVALGVMLMVVLRRGLMKKTRSKATPKLAMDRAS